jgi:hypothetical protein
MAAFVHAWPRIGVVAIIPKYATAWQSLAQASPNPLFFNVLQRAAVPANQPCVVGKDGNH